MKRVLYISCAREYSGAEITFERLILANRASVSAVVLCPPGPLAERFRHSKVDVVTSPHVAPLDTQGIRRLIRLPLKLTRSAVTILRAQRECDAEVIHAVNIAAGLYALLPCLISKLGLSRRRSRWIWTTQDMAYPYRHDAMIAKACCLLFDEASTCSVAARLAHSASGQKIKVIYNGLNIKEFQYSIELRSQFRTHYGLGVDAVAIGILGIVSEFKGHHLLLEALQRITQDGREVHLFIIGPVWPQHQKYAKTLHDFVEKNVTQAKVTWTGTIADVAAVYSGLDIVVNSTLSSHGEPFGNTICEAMACQRVVLAPRAGGPSEIIDDGVDGFLCAPDSVGALAARLNHILEHWNNLQPVRDAARETVIKRFSAEVMVEEYNGLYGNGSTKGGTHAALSKLTRWPSLEFLLSGRLKRDSLILVGLQVFYKLCGLLLLVVISRRLSTSDIGYFFFAVAFAEAFLLVANFSLNAVLMRRVSEEHEQASKHLAALLGFRAVSGPIYLVCVVAAAMLFSPQSASLIAAIAVFTLLEDVYFLLVSMFIAVERVVYSAWIGVVIELLFLGMFVVGMYRWPALSVLVWTNMARSILLFATALWVIHRRICRLRIAWDSQLIKSGFPFFVMTVVSMVQAKISPLLLGILTGYSAVGHFELAMSLALASAFIPAAIGSILFPRLSAQGFSPANRIATLRAGAAIGVLGALVTTSVLAAAGPLTQILYGRLTSEVAPLLRCLSPFFFLNFVALYLSIILQALRREKEVLRCLIVSSITSMGAHGLLIPIFGSYGAVYAQDISILIQTTLLGIIFFKVYEQRAEAIRNRVDSL